MYQLNCGIQKYSWGRRGHQSKAAVYKQVQDQKFQIEPNQEYSELWMGKKEKHFTQNKFEHKH